MIILIYFMIDSYFVKKKASTFERTTSTYYRVNHDDF